MGQHTKNAEISLSAIDPGERKSIGSCAVDTHVQIEKVSRVESSI